MWVLIGNIPEKRLQRRKKDDPRLCATECILTAVTSFLLRQAATQSSDVLCASVSHERGSYHLRISILAEDLAICSLARDLAIPDWAQREDGFFAIVRTPEELSIVCDEHLVPQNLHANRGWIALQLEGLFNLMEIGILAPFAEALAAGGVSIFVISAFRTDYILVLRGQLPKAIEVLRDLGHVTSTAGMI
jgi:hypothetical protein